MLLNFIHNGVKANWRRFLPGVIMLIMMIVLFRSPLAWMADAFTGNSDPLNSLLLIAILVSMVVKLRSGATSFFRTWNFRFRPWPSLLFIGGIAGFLYCESHLHINIISSSLMLVTLYGMAGMHLPAKIWGRGLVPAVLILLTLPFGNLMDIYIGFPLRMFSADIVEDLLGQLGIDHIKSGTIITIENRASQVDMNCSGLKGLWTGWLFFFAVSWIERLKIGWRWLLLLLMHSSFLLFFNIIRIVTLVLLEFVAGAPQMAETVHVPLGLTGFVFSCAITRVLLLRYKKYGGSGDNKLFVLFLLIIKKIRNFFRLRISFPGLSSNNGTRIAQFTLIGLLLFTISAYTPGETVNSNPVTKSLEWPAEWCVEEIELTKKEVIFFREQGGVAIKKKFSYKGAGGTFIVVTDASWTGHHHPDLCTQAAGHKISDSYTLLVQPHFPIRINEMKEENITGCYWFQSPTLVTEDYSSRMWKELKGEETRWVMISIFFNNTSNMNDEMFEFIQKFYLKINNLLKSTDNESA